MGNGKKLIFFIIIGLFLSSIIIKMHKNKRAKTDKSEISVNIINTYNPSEHIIIIDWDDTILPTTSLISDQSDFENNEKEYLENVVKFIELCLQLSRRVYIITNGDEGWVEGSTKKYVPALTSLLTKCVIISAREENGLKYPTNQYMWKYKTFKRVIEQELDKQDLKSITSIGDSYANEFMALTTISNESKDNWISHKIKTLEKPSVNDIISCHKLLYMHLAKILSLPYSQDLELSKKN